MLEFIRDVRLADAERLLSSGNRSVAEIARRIGIQDISNFGRLFRKRTRLSPRAYRQACRQMRSE